jgi:DNA-binding Xre family transcriptional regulator
VTDAAHAAALKAQEILRKKLDAMIAHGASTETALGIVARHYHIGREWTRGLIAGSKKSVTAEVIEKICQADGLDVGVFFKPGSTP